MQAFNKIVIVVGSLIIHNCSRFYSSKNAIHTCTKDHKSLPVPGRMTIYCAGAIVVFL